jgi:hypothetical protein
MTRRAPVLPAPLAGRRRTRSGPVCLRPAELCSPPSVRARYVTRSDHGTSAWSCLAPASWPPSSLQSP